MIEITEKEKDLYDAFKRMRTLNPELKEMPLAKTFKILETEPAPRYYITFETARIYLQYRKRGLYPPMLKTKKSRAMINALYGSYKYLKKKYKGKKDWEIIELTISSPAPSFFIGSQTMSHIVTKLNSIL